MSASRVFLAAADNLRLVGSGAYPAAVAAAVDLLYSAVASGGKLLVCGNGGSAADADHLAAELVGRFGAAPRPPVPAVALTSNSAFLTAWSNDTTFDDVFARQVEALARRGDVVLGISTSGNSPNVVRALSRARELGVTTLGMTGKGGGLLAPHCDVLMAVPLEETARIQEIHLVTYHAICEALERRLSQSASEQLAD